MTVKELIENLSKITDKNKEVFVFCEFDVCQCDLMKINFIDNSLQDRVDINVG